METLIYFENLLFGNAADIVPKNADIVPKVIDIVPDFRYNGLMNYMRRYHND